MLVLKAAELSLVGGLTQHNIPTTKFALYQSKRKHLHLPLSLSLYIYIYIYKYIYINAWKVISASKRVVQFFFLR